MFKTDDGFGHHAKITVCLRRLTPRHGGAAKRRKKLIFIIVALRLIH
jgi:hypothetical protein